VAKSESSEFRPGSPVSDSERQRFSPEYRRRQILDAARKLFAVRPDASVQDVAAEAGVTRQLVGLYFPGGGTGPIYSALFDDFLLSVPQFFESVLPLIGDRSGEAAVAVDDATLRGLIRAVFEAVLDWAEAEVSEPWVFGSGRDRPGSGIGARWDAVQESFADALISLRPEFGGVPEVRAALILECEATGKLVGMRLSGMVEREPAVRIVIERFFALYTVALPALLA